VDLAPAEIDGNAVERQDAGEALGHPGDLDQAPAGRHKLAGEARGRRVRL
jgi:hypothetical protein